MARVEERTPYIIVAFQECERMNSLMSEIRRSLKELSLGLKVTQWFTTNQYWFTFLYVSKEDKSDDAINGVSRLLTKNLFEILKKVYLSVLYVAQN